MKTLKEIKHRLKVLNPVLKKNFSVDTMELFGLMSEESKLKKAIWTF